MKVKSCSINIRTAFFVFYYFWVGTGQTDRQTAKLVGQAPGQRKLIKVNTTNKNTAYVNSLLHYPRAARRRGRGRRWRVPIILH